MSNSLYPPSQILRVIEENIDGCGSDVELYVYFNNDHIADTHGPALAKILRALKVDEQLGEYATSYDYIAEAVSQFNAANRPTGIEAEAICAPYSHTVYF